MVNDLMILFRKTLFSWRSFRNAHCAEAVDGHLASAVIHHCPEGVGRFAELGKCESVGGSAERCCSIDHRNCLFGLVDDHEHGVFLGVLFGIDVACRDGDDEIGVADGCRDIWDVGLACIAERTDFSEVDGLHAIGFGCTFGKLLDQRVAMAHLAHGCGKETADLLSRELACQLVEFGEEITLLDLCFGLWVSDRLGDATHVADALPRSTYDGANFSVESSKDSLFDCSHSLMDFGC